MPFVSKKQRAYCFAEMRRNIKANKPVKWDCYSYGKHSKNSKKTSKIRNVKRKIHIGKRGGKYKIVNGRKVYV